MSTGRPATRISGLGTCLVRGSSRVPFPANGMTTFTSPASPHTGGRGRRGRRGGSGASYSPVPILQAHHVVDLRGGGLEQVRGGHRLHLMDRERGDVVALPRPHPPLDQLVALFHPEDDLAGENVDGLVLPIVVLQAQDVSRLDVEDLPHVPIGQRPDQLVAPRLLDAVGNLHVTTVSSVRTSSSARCISAAEGQRWSRFLASARRITWVSEGGISGLMNCGSSGASSRCFAISAITLGAMKTLRPVTHSNNTA